MKRKLGLVPKLIIAIILGILIGQYAPLGLCSLIVTLSGIFSNFLKFVIPLMILAYVSTSIPVLLLFILFSNGFTEIINLELLASEVLRAVAGSIGLICTIPITVRLVGRFHHTS